MRVIHIVPALFSSNEGVIGGAERHVMELARYMVAKVETTIVSFADKERTESVGGVKIHVIGNPWYVRGQRSNPMAFKPLLSLLRKGDVIHCHQQHVLASSLAAIFCRLTGRRVFVSDLGGGGWDISAYFSTDKIYHGHLHISEYSRRIFGQEKSTRAHVILEGVDTEKFSPDRSVCKTNDVAFVGRILPHKGINYLITALPSDMSMQIIGQIYHRDFFENLQALAVGKKVTFRHDCDDTMLVDSYRRSMCVVLPSVYRDIYGIESRVPELLGQALMEGMSCGLPGICTNAGGMPEVIEDGVSGFIVPTNDSQALRNRIAWLRDNPKKRLEMGNAARSRVLSKFTWPAVVQKCLEIYEC